MNTKDEIKHTTRARVVPQAILFDWDNTIADTQMMVLKALNKTLAKMDKPKLEHYMSSLERTTFFKQTFSENWNQAYSIFIDHLKSENSESIRIFPGFRDFLDLVVEKGIFTGIVSNKDGKLLRKEVDSLGLTERFNVIVGSGDTDQDKPSPKPLLHALSVGKIRPSVETVLFIGDSVIDMQCAKNASVRGIAYRSLQLEGFNEVETIQSYDQAKTLLLRQI